MSSPTTQFAVGQKFGIGVGEGYDRFEVLLEVTKRTPKQVTFKTKFNETYTVKVRAPYFHGTAEWAMPYGQYSMAPTIHADNALEA